MAVATAHAHLRVDVAGGQTVLQALDCLLQQRHRRRDVTHDARVLHGLEQRVQRRLQRAVVGRTHRQAQSRLALVPIRLPVLVI